MAFWVGITGGIASGKTTISNFFGKLDVPIINSDLIARQITSSKGEALDILHGKLDKRYFLEDGSINRKLVKQKLFYDEQFKKMLENILHPIILKNINQEKQKYDNFIYGIIEIPLLYEQRDKFLPIVDRVLIIDINYSNQVQRVVKRDNIIENYAKKIILNQTNSKKRNLIADDIIVNNDGLDSLYIKVIELHKFYTDFFKKIDYDRKKNMF